MVKKYTGIQRRVLHLYREFLREARKLDDTTSGHEPSKRKKFVAVVRRQFDEDKGKAKPMEFDKIEYMLRTAYRRLELVRTPGFKGLS
mmetsp:Transcript_20973/g.36083  ORF Transcript_20973/g.36083 Transcript_20973/m.36083 type:complete len:88 (-) Transcript_20973:324-587(-)